MKLAIRGPEGSRLPLRRSSAVEIQAEFVVGHDAWFTRSEISDGTWTGFTGQGQGNVTANPLFLSGWPRVDMHVPAKSPVVDAGSPADAPVDDAEGRPRDAKPDIGAYEWRPASEKMRLPMIIKAR